VWAAEPVWTFRRNLPSIRYTDYIIWSPMYCSLDVSKAQVLLVALAREIPFHTLELTISALSC